MTDKPKRDLSDLEGSHRQEIQVVRVGQTMLSVEDYEFMEGKAKGPVHEYDVIYCNSRKIKGLVIEVGKHTALVQYVPEGMTVKDVQARYRKAQEKKQAKSGRATPSPILNATGAPVNGKVNIVQPAKKKIIKPN